MDYNKFGLVNTTEMFSDAIAHKYAIPAFNFYNMETLNAILAAARETHSPVILAVSESALHYMGDNMLMGMIMGAKLTTRDCVALHLDHGASVDACKHAIDIGFSSVMIDASQKNFSENIELTQRVIEYAHKHNVTVESELGVIAGTEDENTSSEKSLYTNPNDAYEFVKRTNVDSLAIAIGTNHGAYKCKSEFKGLRFDVLSEIVNLLPKTPLVLHGASRIPQHLVGIIEKFGGKMENACGIPMDDIRQAVSMHVAKVNVDSDSRIAFTAGIRKTLATNPKMFNPRDYLSVATDMVKQNCIDEIKNVMNSANKLK